MSSAARRIAWRAPLPSWRNALPSSRGSDLPAQRERPPADYILLILILLLALGLRLYRIQAQSLWNDEGTSIALASRDLVTITRSAANDIHPPLYYYILHFWVALSGNSELGARSLSALTGTLVVVITFGLARALVRKTAALVAAFFAALSPFQVYYSQEARMYALMALLGAASTYSCLRLLMHWQGGARRGGRNSSWPQRCLPALTYTLLTMALLHTHYFAATVVVLHNLVFLGWLMGAARTEGTRVLQSHAAYLARWVLLQGLICLSYLPWLFLANRALRYWPAISQPLSLSALLLDSLRVFSLGLSVEPGFHPLLWGFALLLALGTAALTWVPWRARTEEPAHRHPPQVAILLYLLVPVAAMYVLSLRRPLYNAKFLLLCSPPFCVLLACGAFLLLGQRGEPCRALRHFAGEGGTCPRVRFVAFLAALLFVAGASLSSLRAYYFDPRYARDDYRGIAQYIEAIEQPNDAILINAPGQFETFTHYYRGILPLHPLPRQRPLDEAQTEADLRQMVAGRKHVYSVLWATDESDPGRFIEGWLDQNAYKASDSWYGNVRLAVYAVPGSARVGIENSLEVTLGDKVRLLGYNLYSTQVMPGDVLQLTLFWQALTPITERYKVFTHVLDAHSHLVGQRDAEPGGGAKITTVWQVGELIADNYGLPILPATPPGDYLIEVGMYGLNDGRRLSATQNGEAIGDRVLLKQVRVLPASAPPPLTLLGMSRPMHTRFDDVTLLGYHLAKLGYEHQPEAAIRAGDILHLTLFWQAVREASQDIQLLLQLEDSNGQVWWQQQSQPTEALYPSNLWRAQEIVRDQHNIPLPADLPGGSYRFSLSVHRLPALEAVGAPVTLTKVVVQ